MMKRILSVLLEEFKDLIPNTRDSVEREAGFTEVPSMINVAIGARRAGKTYVIYQKVRELLNQGVLLNQILYLNFEDDRLLPMSNKQLGELLEAFYELYPQNHDKLCYLFLDEIQNIEDWALVVRRFDDKKKVKIYLTGSSAKLLSKEIATSLRGRSIATEVWPYSFHEYCLAQSIVKPETPIGKKKLDQFYQHFCDYFSVGGFPIVQKIHSDERRTVLQSYVDTVIFRDIIERHKITNIFLIKYLIKTLIKNVAAPFSVHKFYNDVKSQGFKVGKDTIYQYLDYIEDTFLVFALPVFTESIRKMQQVLKKIYIIDNGLVRANRLGLSLQWGSLFENQIYLDLRRKGCTVHYYKTEGGYEVDFVVENKDGSMELLQVVWDMTDPETVDREERALRYAEKELGIKGRIVTPQDYLLDFLENEKSLFFR